MNLSHKTVKQLRQEKNRVKVLHYRHIQHIDGERIEFVPICDIQNPSQMLGKGGKTEVFLTTPEGKNYKGVAGCVRNDPFSYKMGVKIALGKLIELN